jgi:tetratricopeptide (TPR) repeat protein
MGDRAGARDDLKAASDQNGRLAPDALDALGRVSLAEGKPAEAEAYHRMALAQRPAFLDARLNLAIALLKKDDAASAERELREVIKARPRDAKAWTTLGTALVRLERLVEAKASYERALDIDDKDATAHYDYALCAERFGNFIYAIQEYESTIKLEPSHWKALANLSRLYRESGRGPKALEFIDRAIAIRPDVADLHLHRANTLAALRRDQDARLSLEMFVKLATPGDPRLPAAKRAIDEGLPAPSPGSGRVESPKPQAPQPQPNAPEFR